MAACRDVERGSGAVAGGPLLVLRLEGLIVALASIAAYFISMDLPWQMFAWLILVPDISFTAYLAGPVIGARGYNLMHSFLGPITALTLGVALDHSTIIGIALIWIAHIGIDRSLGYGLKYADTFTHTHLGFLGKAGKHSS